MAFIQATAATGLRTSKVLSADNTIPERHIVITSLRNAAPRLGLSASVISTLDAMLSCLAPNRNHHTVFASNATLTFRRNGISDRTIRRHAATLQEVGLLIRHDSPNRKRFTKHSSNEGKSLRFGFDLSPLFARLNEIATMAAEVLKEQEQISYLRAKIRTVANAILLEHENNSIALHIFRVLRRKLTLYDCEQILAQLPANIVEAETDCDQSTSITTIMTASDGQIVRHHHKSNKEHTDKEDLHRENIAIITTEDTTITVPKLILACPEAAQFSLRKIETVSDVVAHARTLAPMIGITSQCYEAAHKQLGAMRAAATVWAILQFHDKIKSAGAYFRAITTGSKSNGFSPEKLIHRLAETQRYAT